MLQRSFEQLYFIHGMVALYFLHGALANDEDTDGCTIAGFVGAASVPHLFVDVISVARGPSQQHTRCATAQYHFQNQQLVHAALQIYSAE